MVCVCCAPPPPCEPCPDCEWPSNRGEFGPDQDRVDCFGTQTLPSTRSQDIYAFGNYPGGGLPSGISWKSGYPAALSGCNWALVVDSRSVDCCYDNCTINGVPNTIALGSIVQSRYRIMLINCPEDEEPFVTDITSLAIDGDLEQEVSTSAQFCGEPVACTPWLDFYDDPVPVCNEFP